MPRPTLHPEGDSSEQPSESEIFAAIEAALARGDVDVAIRELHRQATFLGGGSDFLLEGGGRPREARFWWLVGRAYEAKGDAYRRAATLAFRRSQALNPTPETAAKIDAADAGKIAPCPLAIVTPPRPRPAQDWRGVYSTLRPRGPLSAADAPGPLCLPACAGGRSAWNEEGVASFPPLTKCQTACRGDSPWFVASSSNEHGAETTFDLVTTVWNVGAATFQTYTVGQAHAGRCGPGTYEFNVVAEANTFHVTSLYNWTFPGVVTVQGQSAGVCGSPNNGTRTDFFFDSSWRPIIALNFMMEADEHPYATLRDAYRATVGKEGLTISGNAACEQLIPLGLRDN
jgi:hypothetical protein